MVRFARLAFLALCGTLYCLSASAQELGAVTGGSPEEQRTDANIVTGLDVSSSVTGEETAIQVEGLALAIQSPEIIGAIQRGRYKRIGFAVYLWADGEFPVVVGWRTIGSPEDAVAAATEMTARLQEIQRQHSRVGNLTNLSKALEAGGAMLATAPFASHRAIINIVGDGEDNVGEGPEQARDQLVTRGVDINGVVLGGEQTVAEYFRRSVVGGPMAFVITVGAREELAGAWRRKFVTEIAFNSAALERPDRL